jgi:hypothetical protein
MFRDPLTWLKALVRLRFEKNDPMRVVGQMRRAGQTGEKLDSTKAVNHEP